MKELITHHVSGTHVYPRVIEDALLTHPSVREAAACALPDEQADGDRIYAAVTLDGHAVGEETLRAHVRSALGQDHLVPDCLEVLSELPLTRVGKIGKRALLAEYSRRRASVR
ncbi:hypothetical protein [Streptomyces sp. NPDC101150]|uniref:AMP-binding enzyme n=1 Tax=Streptomyces sp. NPDC101150 TaxID=3366114 RepID=UPI0037FEFF3E